MPLVTDQAICLRVTPFSETSQVVTLFTREYGRLRLVAKGARRRTKAGKGSFDGGLDLLDGGDATFSHTPEKDLSLLTAWRLTDAHAPLRQHGRAIWLGLYAAELVDRLIEEHDAHPRLFDGLVRLLARLADASAREAVMLAFQLNLLRQTGVLPDFGRCAGGGSPAGAERLAFSPTLAQLVRDDRIEQVADATPVPRVAVEAIVGLLRLARAGGELPRLTRTQTDPANRLLALHVQHQIGARLRVARYILSDSD